eukprot:1137433-Pelagomonas_calceolata.AAC.1
MEKRRSNGPCWHPSCGIIPKEINHWKIINHWMFQLHFSCGRACRVRRPRAITRTRTFVLHNLFSTTAAAMQALHKGMQKAQAKSPDKQFFIFVSIGCSPQLLLLLCRSCARACRRHRPRAPRSQTTRGQTMRQAPAKPMQLRRAQTKLRRGPKQRRLGRVGSSTGSWGNCCAGHTHILP